MKFCYFDESGTGNEAFAVVAGVIVDSQRMHLTKDHWASLLSHLSEVVGRELDELHTRDFYPGNGPFRALSGTQRADYISSIIEWLSDRKHDFVFSAIDKTQFAKTAANGQMLRELETPWLLGAFHCVLAIQKAHQRHPKNKGHTVLVFDRKGHEEARLANLVSKSQHWGDEYYARGKRQGSLDQIVDAPHFADSKQVPLLQVADFLAYFLRRHAEIAHGMAQIRYPEEAERVSHWIRQLSERALDVAHTYPLKGRCHAAEVFFQHCPPALRRLGVS